MKLEREIELIDIDASAQMALLQFSTCERESTAVPTSIHCDHLISAYAGAEADLKVRYIREIGKNQIGLLEWFGVLEKRMKLIRIWNDRELLLVIRKCLIS